MLSFLPAVAREVVYSIGQYLTMVPDPQRIHFQWPVFLVFLRFARFLPPLNAGMRGRVEGVIMRRAESGAA